MAAGREGVDNYNEEEDEPYGQTKETVDSWNGREGLVIDTDNIEPGDSRDIEGSFTPRSLEKSGSQSPRKLKTVAARFKKKMNWRKSEKQSAAEAE